MSDFQEVFEVLDLEYWFEREGVAHRMTRGSSGMQIHVQECPSCHNRKWKTYLNADSGLGNCFVCNESFNKYKFVSQTLGLSAKDTFDHVKEVIKEQGWKPKRKTTAAVEHGEVKLPLSFELPTPTGQNLLYLEKRGIDVELTKYFHLRYCEDGWWNYKDEDGSTRGQNFKERIIIPVYDLDGTLVTFQGRDVIGTSEQKYLFPRTLPGTGRFLYNGQNAVRAKRAVMNEGAFDVFATKKALDEDVALRDVVPIGSFGKHLSYGSLDGNDQLGRILDLKRNGLEEVTIMWDGEAKALLAALSAAKLIHGVGLRVRIAVLPAGKDPNEVLGEVVRDAFYKASLYTLRLEIMWRIKNPYSV